MPTYFRFPDMVVIVSKEEKHAITEPVEFELRITGVIMDYDDIVTCDNCKLVQPAGADKCQNCKEELDQDKVLRFWKFSPDMTDVDLTTKPLPIPDEL